MKIQLDHKIEIEVKEGNKTKEKLTIFYREFTQAEKKEQDGIKKQFFAINKKAQKLARKQDSLNKKAQLLELNEEYEKALEAIDKKDELEDELETLLEELTVISGDDPEAFAEKTAQRRFETLVSGKDKDALLVYAEIKSYAQLMQSLDEAKRELEKKPSGE